MKHKCGCITKKEKGTIYFEKMCKTHKLNQKYIWIAMQHKENKK